MKILFALGILILGCSGANAAGVAAPATSAPYEVHEWGLVRALAGDVLNAGAIAPPAVIEPMIADKPVLYFHSDASLRLSSVSVDGNGGAIVEAWPAVPRTNDASQLVWRDVTVDPSGACQPSPLPSASDPACQSAPDHCEVASLAEVRVPGSACVHVQGTTDSLLFYRNRTRAFTPPLRFERHPDGSLSVTHEGDSPVPGWMIHLHADNGSVRAAAVRPPAPHQTITVGEHANDVLADHPVMPSDPEPGRRAVRETMHDIGLSDGEIDAFLRAWDPTIFGMNRIADDEVADRRGMDIDAVPTESVLYFLPVTDCDHVARLSFDPAPTRVRRAIAMWSAIRPSGASH